MLRKKLFLLLVLITLQSVAQKAQKVLSIHYTKNPPKIDAVLDDIVWQNAEKVSGFSMYKPGFGDAEPEGQKTVVQMAYDNGALYVAAILQVPDTYTIPKQFTTRDSFGQSDTFSVAINPDNDGINDFVFHVMSSGTQADARVSIDGADFSWNAIWDSEVFVGAHFWRVEMRIPYAALRFNNKVTHDWGINFYRNNSLTHEKYSWNFIDKEKGKKSEYAGILRGISQITPPLRLSFYPFTQGSVNLYDTDISWHGTAGMDVKYGISESFTLDATLVPDFGQTEFDDLVLNLGPFEQQYEEKRAFFTEGTELFEKGDLFYSRRVGGEPMLYDAADEDLKTHEVMENNPEKTKMLNAIKISGRTQKGLGIGVFNAFTAKSNAVIKDTLLQTSRVFETNPFTNYNILVLDRNFQGNSSIGIINTNVYRKDGFAQANVTSAVLDYTTKNNKYQIESDLSMSLKSDEETGYKSYVSVGEVAGAHQYSLSVDMNDSNYDKNDLGYQEYNNFVVYEANYSYHNLKPIGVFNAMHFGAWGNVEYRYNPYLYTDNGVGVYAGFRTKKHHSFGMNINASFGNKYDYYEPQTEGRFFKKQQMQYINSYYRSNYAKPFAFFLSLIYGKQLGSTQPESSMSIKLRPRYRFNDRFQIVYSLFNGKVFNRKGYVDDDEDAILFGNRDGRAWVNSLQGKYHISNKSALTLTFRHYWKQAKYDAQLYYLEEDGQLSLDERTGNYDKNVNYWNLDFNYSWEFAPGSQLIAQYRNALESMNRKTHLNMLENLNDISQEPLSHTFSIKLIYYIDYNKLKF